MIDETERRRSLQIAHNEANGIVPQTISKPINDLAGVAQVVIDSDDDALQEVVAQASEMSDRAELNSLVETTRAEMLAAGGYASQVEAQKLYEWRYAKYKGAMFYCSIPTRLCASILSAIW